MSINKFNLLNKSEDKKKEEYLKILNLNFQSGQEMLKNYEKSMIR